MRSSKTEIDLALIDVRKAYRLLHDYQRAALDAANYIGAQFGFTYAGGSPNFSECSPRDGKGSLDACAWDWLNMVAYDFYFTRIVGEDDMLRLSIWLASDTGYFISDDPEPLQTDIHTFAPAEKSGTKVGFLLYRDSAEEFGDIMGERDSIRRFLENDEDLAAQLLDAGIFGKCYDFSRLCDEASTDRVIADLVRLARAHGFPLARIRKAL